MSAATSTASGGTTLHMIMAGKSFTICNGQKQLSLPSGKCCVANRHRKRKVSKMEFLRMLSRGSGVCSSRLLHPAFARRVSHEKRRDVRTISIYVRQYTSQLLTSFQYILVRIIFPPPSLLLSQHAAYLRRWRAGGKILLFVIHRAWTSSGISRRSLLPPKYC